MNCSVPEFFLDDDRNLVDTFGDETVELLWDNGPVFRRTSQEEFRSRCGISGSSAGEPFLEDEMASWLNYPLIYGEERGTVGSDQPTIAAPLDCEVLKTQQKFFRPLESGGSTIEQGEHSSGGKGESSSILISETEGSDPSNPGLDSRKRKEPEAEDSDSIYESIEKHDDGRKSALKRRLRATEVHNLSERRRRDRINEKMKALQELLPRCNKVFNILIFPKSLSYISKIEIFPLCISQSDKASMLDDAIRYLKFLQSQVQMMAMGYNMFPMMVPGIHNHYHSNRHHQFLPQMGMAMPMGLNMGLGMRSFNGPLPPPFFPVLSGPHMGPPRATHLSQGPLPTVDPAVAHSGQHQNPMFPQENANR